MNRHKGNTALRVALIYALIGVAWILWSDQVLAQLPLSAEEFTALQTLKGWLFVFGSAILIFFLLRRELKRLQVLRSEHEESERTLSSLMRNLPGIFYRSSSEGAWSLEHISGGIKELTGYDAGALLRSQKVTYADLVHQADKEQARTSIEQAVKEAKPYQVIYRLAPRKGKMRWVWEQGRGVEGARGQLTGYEGFIADVTERLEAEEEARRRARQQGALNDIISASSKAKDIQDLIEAVLEHCLKIFGNQTGLIWIEDYLEFVGIPQEHVLKLLNNLQIHVVGVKRPVVVQNWEEATETVSQTALSEIFVKLKLYSSLFIPVVAEGRLIGGVSLMDGEPRRWNEEDVSLAEAICSQLGSAAARLGLLETIQEQAQLLQRILDTVQEGIFTLDVDRTILVANPSARSFLRKISGIGPGEVLKEIGGRHLEEFLVPRMDGLPHEIESIDEEEKLFEIYPNPVEVGSHEAAWTILVRDVTEVREVQRRVQEQIRRGAVGQLAAGIAHDFNNIVAAIILYSEMVLALPELSSKGRQRVTTIIEQAHRAATLTRQILDFSRRGIMEPHPMDLVPFIKELVKLLERTLPENIRVQMDYADYDYIVSTDPARIQQVFMNLAVNARDAMPSGGNLEFNLSVVEIGEGDSPPHHEMSPGEWVQIKVSDTGKGIPAEEIPNLFEPFFTTKPPGEGTGLGLAQVFGIVTQHGGHIDVLSELGEGTTFRIFLPALPVTSLSGIIPEELEPIEGKRETILVVEDDKPMREALVETLEIMNYQVLSAEDGLEALQYFDQEKNIDLVLSDLVMPEMGGVALHAALKERHPGVKMVVMTGYPLAEGGKDLLEQGIVAWLQKPLDGETLGKAMRKILEEGVG
jgi:PAS domain S-box-containing protein